jgi:hypothetical protein
MKRIWPVLLSSCVLLAASACQGATGASAPTAPTAAASSVTRTEVIQYTPVVPSGEAQAGRCWTGSLAVARDNAWRCMVGNQIYDPCFAVGGNSAIVCGADPITNKPGFVVNLTEPLPAPDVPAQAKENYTGWLVQLADGTVCNFATGATTGVNGERLNYLCSNKTGLLGDLHPGQVWTANEVVIEVGKNGPTLKQSETVQIRTVWQ